MLICVIFVVCVCKVFAVMDREWMYKTSRLEQAYLDHVTKFIAAHYTTTYLQRPTVGRYKLVQRPTVGPYIHIASDLTRGYKWRRYKL